MNTGLRHILITVVLAALAAAAGAWLCANYVLHQAGPPSLHDVVHRDLDLSADQERRLEAIEVRYAAEKKRLEADMRAANRELAAALAAGDKTSPKVDAAVDHLHHAMGALQKATIAHVFDMRAVLTPGQAKTFDAEVVAALTDEGR